ncbi:MAG: galactose mutarotase [Paludibacteraceae bacterium]|nr:galactose mutarotase [Paludibacteraceae bacterium]
MVNIETFTGMVKGKQIRLFELRNPQGMVAQITNYGAKVVSLMAPDKNGNFADVVLGFSTLEEWQKKETYFNAIIGRCANRIKDGKFTLDGKQYQLAQNNGTNHLHGGTCGFNEKVWEVVGQTRHSVSLHYRSMDGEEQYPGTLDVYVTYNLTLDNALEITYEAKTNRPTIVGFTNHSYFNLKGEGEGNIKDHYLQIFADEYTPFDSTACPTGEVLTVENTPMDFRTEQLIAQRIDLPFFAPGRGIDNNWVLRKENTDGKKVPQLAARLRAQERTMEVWTTMPGLQVYTGNWVEKNIGKSGRQYDVQTAVCLEAQNFPNAINCSNFPSPILRPGEVYFEQCIYKFV